MYGDTSAVSRCCRAAKRVGGRLATYCVAVVVVAAIAAVVVCAIAARITAAVMDDVYHS
jgi:hypothetical protein